MSRLKSALRETWPRLAIVAIVIGVWELVSLTGFYSHVVLPTPASVWRSLQANIANGEIPRAVGKSLVRLGLGFGFAIVLGTLIGLLMGASSLVHRSLGGLMVGLQSLPSIAWLPLAILWFGLTRGAILFVVIIGALPSVAIATSASVRQVSPLYERAGRTLGAKGWRLWRSVIFPAAVPGYLGGLQQGWAFAWRGLMAGELIAGAAQVGLGHSLVVAQEQFKSAEVIALMLVIVLIGMVVDLVVFGTIDRRIRARRGLAAPA